MKLLLAITTLFFSINVFASYQSCPKKWVKENLQTYDLFKSVKGLQQVGDCKIEIRLCKSNEIDSADALVGDVLITKDRNEYYIPLYVEQNGTGTSSVLKTIIGDLFYKFNDANEDSYNGQNEKDGLTIVLNKTKNGIDEISMAQKNDHIFSKFLFLKFPKYLTCRTPEREKELREQDHRP